MGIKHYFSLGSFTTDSAFSLLLGQGLSPIVAQAGLEFYKLNSKSSSLNLLPAGIRGVPHHTSPGLYTLKPVFLMCLNSGVTEA